MQEEFGSKRLSVKNWRTPDPVWQHFGHSPLPLSPADAWASDVLAIGLEPVVRSPSKTI
jgi:hypothetical protein